MNHLLKKNVSLKLPLSQYLLEHLFDHLILVVLEDQFFPEED
jgi:hypothetical protein